MLQQQQLAAKQQQQQPSIFPPPPPPANEPKRPDDLPVGSKSLDEEREAMRVKERMKKDTAAAVEQMKARLRAMGLYKDKDKGSKVVDQAEDAAGKGGGADDDKVAPLADTASKVTEREGGNDEDYFDNDAELVPPVAVSPTDGHDVSVVGGGMDEGALTAKTAKGGLGGILKSLFTKSKGSHGGTAPQYVEETMDAAKAPAVGVPLEQAQLAVQDHDGSMETKVKGTVLDGISRWQEGFDWEWRSFNPLVALLLNVAFSGRWVFNYCHRGQGSG